MVNVFTPGSFTKNFGNGVNFEKLRKAVADGFRGTLQRTTRTDWRKNAGIEDRDRQLVPLNFFLHSLKEESGDFVVVDELVEQCVKQPHSAIFERLALFALHLSNSGTWKGSHWPDGHVAGWCREFIVTVAWKNGKWQRSAFEEKVLTAFIDKHVDALPRTKRKILTNYLYLVKLAGVLEGSEAVDLQPSLWGQNACWLFWDRSMYQQQLSSHPAVGDLLAAFIQHEIYKLLGCSKETGLEIAKSAAGSYLAAGALGRFH
jgi:hypothetical protein